ncbi:N-acetylmuramoyl-L-alanine amidase family protein [Neotamlana laminarinivorans]|uniref:N-acetylmuramoyl-L-alanine amidase n=1 Tax=Neotamlana laminarinivorans TaxID=2883124 RepID=A0A9X1L2F4_9FLAO|nr:N-acetylmuramoyl-L-alanine amidase [Tamlana laminarinivorans]MCB4797519.1 N-acetylmuramoyl-L-alanine amidase [Tamlana laminarinivorans]
MILKIKNISTSLKTTIAYVFVCFIILLTFSSFSNISKAAKPKPFVVVLDAGHGGKDSGNLGNGYRESEIALKVVLEVGRLLEKTPNIKVVYTRKTDVFIDLVERGRIANKANADLFVSVHCNSHNSSAHGTETFVLGTHRNKTNFEVAKNENSVIFMEDDYEKNYNGFDPNSPESVMGILLSQEEYLDQSIMLASAIQQKFTTDLKRKNRGVKQAGFIVLHQTVMPSVLVELGFLTYKQEGAYLNSKKGQLQISSAISNAILDYKSKVNHSESVYYDSVETNNVTTNGVTFKIQIAASSKELETKPYNFNGLNNITREKEGTLYKYYYGNTSSYEYTKQLEAEAKAKGYNSCFVTAFKDGKKIEIQEALKTDAD